MFDPRPSQDRFKDHRDRVAVDLEDAALLALVDASRGNVPRLAEIIERAGSPLAIVEGRAHLGGRDLAIARALASRLDPDAVDLWAEILSDSLARSPGTTFVSVRHDAYPGNLRAVGGRPTFLFVRGGVVPDDSRAVAVVGSRKASRAGSAAARSLAAALAEAGITVVSGLAAGIDTAAHSGAIEAGGRTIASVGTGVDRTYPADNAELAGAVERHGAVVSRFWPDAPAKADSFRQRNVVTSGLSLATVVVEAGPMSGARLQARIALEQHRPLVLYRALVDSQPWAARLASRPDVTVVDGADEVCELARALSPDPRGQQLTLF
ncbi:MAG TPA: DNA-processing protein DprA [Acidimicrobiales bacterium]|nr:DNA-processing protein DprA [Acidimicrobiales bacterium]